MKLDLEAIEETARLAVSGSGVVTATETLALVARVRELEAVVERVLAAELRADSTRGFMSCCDSHDCRCPKSRSTGDCACGRVEFDAAFDAAHKLLEAR